MDQNPLDLKKAFNLIQSVGMDSGNSWKQSAAQPSSSQLSSNSMIAVCPVSCTRGALRSFLSDQRDQAPLPPVPDAVQRGAF